MVPSENADIDLQQTPWHREDGGQIVLKASRVAIHVRPRSPGRSPAKFVPVDANWATQPDVSAPRDIRARPVLHLDVAPPHHPHQQRNAGGRQQGTLKLAPHAVIDVVQFQPRGAAPPGAAVSVTVIPPEGRAGTTGTAATAAALAAMPSASRSAFQAAVRGGGRQDITAVPNSKAVAAAAGPAAATATAAAAGAMAAPPFGFAPVLNHAAVATPTAARPGSVAGRSGNVRDGGAALLAELLGTYATQMAGAPVQPQPAAVPGPATTSSWAITRPFDYTTGGHQQGSSDSPSAARASFSFLPRGPGPDSGGVSFLRESTGLPWSRDDLAASLAFAGGVPNPEAEARRARRQHRKRVARIVVDHWKQFAAEGLRAVTARRHLRRRRLTAAWIAWQAEIAAARSRMRLAAVYDMKHSYLALGRCVQAWSAAAKRLALMRSLQERVAVNRLTRLSRACLRAWRGRCYHSAEKRRRRLQAWFYYCFSTLTRALRKWHGWVEGQRAKARRANWAEAQHAVALRRKALAAWRRRLAQRRWKAAAVDAADALRRRSAMQHAVRRWRDAAAACRVAREAAAAALRATAAGMQAQRAAETFGAWQAYAVGRRRRRQRERYAAAYMRRWWQLVALWAWRQRAARARRMRVCERELQRVGMRVRLGLWWSRWRGAAELLQGQRTGELRAAVLGRACWAAWRAAVEHGAAKRELLRVARRRVGRIVAAAAMAVWRARAAHWRAKDAAAALAASWHRRRALARLLRGWCREAARRVAKAAAAAAAARHWRRKALRRAIRLWRRYAWRQGMKLAAQEHRSARVLRVALRGWLAHTRYKARKELDRRRAVRHRYLTLLHSGLLAFRASLERRMAKQRDWADLARLHARHVARVVLRAWRQRFLPVAMAKRAVGRRADGQRRAALLRAALEGWAREGARLAAKHARQREASGYAALRLLRRALRRWAAVPALQAEWRAAKMARLTEVAAVLAAAAARRLLAAWREVHEDWVMKRFQDTRALSAWRRRVLRRALTCWALYTANRHAAGLLTARALGAHRARVLSAVLSALAQHAAARRAKRRLAAVASEHRRLGLLRRGIAAMAWYGGYRAAKARGYVAARAQYVRRLQREGAAAWLHVGLELRQQRIELLAAQQARALAQQLARVEPFARRWLQAVRSRRSGGSRARLQPPLIGASTTLGTIGPAAASNFVDFTLGYAGPRASWPAPTAAVTAVAASSAAGAAGGGKRAAPVQRTAAPLTFNAGAAAAATAAATARRPPPRTPPSVQWGASWIQGGRRVPLDLKSAGHAAPDAPVAGSPPEFGGAAAVGAPVGASSGVVASPSAAAAGGAAWLLAHAGGAQRLVATNQPPAHGASAIGFGSYHDMGRTAAAVTVQLGPLRDLTAPPQPVTAGRLGQTGGAAAPPGPGRVRLPPRCPDFLQPRRPATVGGPSGAPAAVRIPYGRPASSAAAAAAVPFAVPAFTFAGTSAGAGGGYVDACGSFGDSWRGSRGHGGPHGGGDSGAGAGEAGAESSNTGGGSGAFGAWTVPGRLAQPPPLLFFANLPYVKTQGGDGGDSSASAPVAAAEAASCSPSPSISIHCTGPRAPDVLRLPTRGGVEGTGGADSPTRPSSVAFSARPGREQDGHQDSPGVMSASLFDAAASGDGGDLGSGGGGDAPGGPNQDQDVAAAATTSSGAVWRPQPQHPRQQQRQLDPVRRRQQRLHQGEGAPPAAQPPQPATGTGAAPDLDEGELSELESILLHCKRLKQLLAQLERQQGEVAAAAATAPSSAGSGSEAGSVEAAAGAAAAETAKAWNGTALGRNQGQQQQRQLVEVQQQAAEVRAALVALRPAVEHAAARLRQIREMAAAG